MCLKRNFSGGGKNKQVPKTVMLNDSMSRMFVGSYLSLHCALTTPL